MLFSNINVFCSKTWNWSGLSFSRSHWCKAVMGRAMWKKRLRGHAKATKALTRLRFRAVWSGPLVSIYRITAESINGGQSPGWSCAHAQDDMNNIPHMLTQIAIFPWRGPFNDSQFSSFETEITQHYMVIEKWKLINLAMRKGTFEEHENSFEKIQISERSCTVLSDVCCNYVQFNLFSTATLVDILNWL